MKPIYSMTGFASVQEEAFSITLKGVNHRFLDLSLRLPGGLDGLEAAMRQVLKERLRRGHVDVTVQVTRREGSTQLQLNEELLAAYVAAFRQAAEKFYLTAEPDLNGMLRQPGVLRMEAGPAVEDSGALAAEVLAALPEALERFSAVRAQEGASLAAELRAAMLRLDRLASMVTGVAWRCAGGASGSAAGANCGSWCRER